MFRWLPVALVLGACGTSHPEEPHRHAPEPQASTGTPPVELSDIAWPELPDGLSADVARCIEDYRALADAPFPERADGMTARAWYEGPFQPWVLRYNAARERCDATFATLDEAGPEAQVVLATQSMLHERMGRRASPHDEYAPVFVMSRYWTLGAACTYQHCGGGPLGAWAAMCRERGSELPPCPPIEAEAPATPPNTL